MKEATTAYLGESVYAAFDGRNIILTTDGFAKQQIALDGKVLAALYRYAAQLLDAR